MNTVELIVQAYFRTCRGCFVMPDVKFEGGNGRQFDLLAVNIVTDDQFHVESSVTHREQNCATTKELRIKFDAKFRGVPKEKEGENTDFARGKMYTEHITAGYRSVGFDPEKVQRLWCSWDCPDRDQLPGFLTTYKAETGISVGMLWFPEVLEELLKTVTTANYDDVVLRMMSLLREYQKRKLQEIRKNTEQIKGSEVIVSGLKHLLSL